MNCRVSEGVSEGWDKNGKLQISRVSELLRFSSYILFRKTKNIILNTRIILQLKKPALASHSSVPEIGDSTEAE